MYFLCSVIIIIFVYIIFDVNYILRTYFTVLCGRFYQHRSNLSDTTTIYGICTFQDCDVYFKNMRLARVLREVDFARYHFYDRTGIYHRSRQLGIKSLQGSTYALCSEPIPMFVPYKINTKLVYWDARSLFLEHEVTTLHDTKVRWLLVSRQYAMGSTKDTTASLLKGLPGSYIVPKCPEYIESWLHSVHTSSFNVQKTD